MRGLSVFILFSILLSCKNRTIHSPEITKELSPVSSWLVKHEDSLFRYVQHAAGLDTLIHKPDDARTWDFMVLDGLCDSLNKKVKGYASCIEIMYSYASNKMPNTEIVLSANYDTSCARAIDSIFADIDTLQHFKLVNICRLLQCLVLLKRLQIM